MFIKKWIPVFCIGLICFIYVIAESIPIGLLTEIAGGIGKSEADTGLVITGFAWVVALLTMPLTTLTSRFDRKSLLLFLLVIFCAGNVVCSLSNTFNSLLAGRIVVAFSHAVFWSMGPPLAVRLAPDGKYAIGMGFVSAGIVMGTSLGLPLAAYIGHVLSWQTAFKLIAIAGGAAMALLYFVLPALPSHNTGSLKNIPLLAKNKTLIFAYVLLILLITGNFTTYSYITAYFKGVFGMSASQVVGLLFVYGISAVAGIFLAGRFMAGYMKQLLMAGVSVMLISYLSISLSVNILYALPGLILWSVAFRTVVMALQSWVIRLAGKAADSAIAMFTGLYNVAIGLGAFTGSMVINASGLKYVSMVSVLFMAVIIIVFSAVYNKVQTDIMRS